MENIALHTKICVNEYKNHIEDMLLLLLFFNAQADTSSFLRTQRAIFLLQNKFNIKKIKNFSYSFYKTNTGPRCYKLVDDVINLFENDFLEILDKVDIAISDNGRKIAHELENYLYKDSDNRDFLELFMDESNRISTLSDRAIRLIVVELKKSIFGFIRHKIINSLEQKTLLQSGITGKAHNGLKLKTEDIVSLLNFFNANIIGQINKSIDVMANGTTQLPKYLNSPKVRITKNCRESIIKEVFEHGLDEQIIGDVVNRFAANPEKYKNDLKYNLSGLSSILIGKSILTFISCDNNSIKEEGDSRVAIVHERMRQTLNNNTIILIAFGLLN